MQKVRFDDLATLKQRVGEEFSPFGDQVTITQEMVNQFADLTLDHQWIHIDTERARRESPFKTTIVHGFFVLSLLPKLRVRKDLEIVGYGNIVNYGSDKLRFVSPVPAGSTVHARSRLIAVEQKPKGVLITEEIEIAVVGAERPALSYLMLMLYQPAA
ncbi:MAG TPA: MaoC family dehydratase [Pseudomonadota bacterium]|jgi:hypothetical protein|nr:MaoC family dehydratase [Pseudomonadota bacterium]